jgi:thiamine kinase-like enzyme
VADLTGMIERLQVELGPISGSPVPLKGGITNRNYRARLGGNEYVIRLPGKDTELLGISREAERIANIAAAGLGIAPAVAAGNDECLVTEFLDCTDVDPDRLRADPGGVARALLAFHGSGTSLPSRFWVPELLEDYAAIVAHRGGALPAEYEATRAIAARIATALPLSAPAPCHDDLLLANILDVAGRDGPRTMLVDWEYAGMGHPLFDLGNLAVNNEFDDPAEDRLLGAYFGARASDGQRAALKLMKLMSDAREAAWGVVQGVISELDFDFAGYAQKHFDRLAAAADDPRLEEWLAAASEGYA